MAFAFTIPTVIAVEAIQAFTFRGAVVAPGTRIDVPPVDAAALVYQHKAKFAGDPGAAPRRGRGRPKKGAPTYARRDLTADPPDGE